MSVDTVLNARTRRRRAIVASLGRVGSSIGIAVVVAACGSPVATFTPTGPADPRAEVAPDQMVADATLGSPGDVVSLSFPQEMVRGILFTLDERVGSGWVHRFNLTSDGPGPEWERSWWLPGDDTVEVPDIGVLGRGPDRVEIPPPAVPGLYRLCTGNAGTNVCAEIRILDGDAGG